MQRWRRLGTRVPPAAERRPMVARGESSNPWIQLRRNPRDRRFGSVGSRDDGQFQGFEDSPLATIGRRSAAEECRRPGTDNDREFTLSQFDGAIDMAKHTVEDIRNLALVG